MYDSSAEKPLPPHAGEAWLRAAPEHLPWLHTEVARRLWSRAECIQTPVSRWVQLGVGRGEPAVAQWLTDRHPQAQGHRLRWPYGSAQGVAADGFAGAMQQQSLAAGTVDMLWSNLQLHWAEQPQQWLRLWRNALRERGYVMFSCFGPDTLRGLRQVYAEQGWGEPAQAFIDMHDVGDMLVRAGFSDPVVDMEKLHLHFSSPRALRAELRELGRNTARRSSAITRGRQWLQGWDAAVQNGLKAADGRLYLEVEVLYGHAFCMGGELPVTAHGTAADGATTETRIGLDTMRRKLRERGLP